MNTQKNIPRGRIVLLAIIIFAIGVIAAPAQTVPPSAREAAASPQWAPRLAHPDTTPHKAPARAHPRLCSSLLQSHGPQNPLPQDSLIYANGPSTGLCDIQGCTVDAWTVNFGYAVTDSIGAGGNVRSFNFAFWLYPGDEVLSLDWSVGTDPFGSDLGQGTAFVTDQFVSSNQFGYEIHTGGIAGFNVNISSGNWVTLQNASVASGNPVYWDENAGPSAAQDSSVGTIPSESFNVSGGGNACTPEQSGNFKVVHDFSGKEDGGGPLGVVIDKAGNLYGPTQYFGTGTVFKLWESGSAWLLNTLYNFAGGAYGAYPEGVIVGPNGILYGGAYGGIQDCGYRNGEYCGLIFGLRPSPTVCLTASCSWTENALYIFTGSTDAWAGGGLVSDQAGNLYGVSMYGGAQQQGVVFELTPSAGGWVESILYNFTGGSDGGVPATILVGNDGNLYGLAGTGGANATGVVFRLTPSANGWTETVLSDLPYSMYGSSPHSLVQDSAGDLFGEWDYWYQEPQGSGETLGVVFMLSPSNGSWVYTELHRGNHQVYTNDVFVNLTLDAAGNLWGTGGGAAGCYNPVLHGYIFELTRGSDGWQYSTPVYWNNTLFDTGGSLALDAQGNLFGTTIDCGKYNGGTVWELKATQ